MQSITCAAPSVTATVWTKRRSLLCWVSQVAHSTGQGTARNDASPGNSGLSHILPRSVTLPVDSLSRRQESVARGKEGNTSWVHAVLIAHVLQWLATKSAYTKNSAYQHKQNVRISKPDTLYFKYCFKVYVGLTLQAPPWEKVAEDMVERWHEIEKIGTV